MRVAVYLDQAFWRSDGDVFAARSFVLFLGKLAESFEELTVAARLGPAPADSHYRLPPPARFLALPNYESAADPLAVARATRESIARFATLLERVDAVWLLGPHPFALLFARMAARRGKRVVLGVRQDMPRYVGKRRPRRLDLRLAASALDLAFRRLARRWPAIVVGPDLARRYAGSRRLLEIYVSLIEAGDVSPPSEVESRDYGGKITILSVGRIDAEKNPLMLPDVLARIDPRFELVVCGDGPLQGELADRLSRRGLAERVELRGHVPIDAGLLDLYRGSHLLLHVSWTEGMPQVLLEAFAAALPVVATAVGGVPEAVGGAVLPVPPGDPDAAAAAIERIATEPKLRGQLVAAAHRIVSEHTIDAEAGRVAAFLRSA